MKQEIKYKCQGSCGGEVTETEFNAGAKTCTA